MVKIYKQPFAHDGDTIAIPDASQPDGKMSTTDGWTHDYQLPKTDPNYKPVGRQEMNGVFKEVTEALGQVQVQGSATWSAVGAPYPINAQVYHNGKQWLALRANSVSPAEGEDWTELVGKQYIDAAVYLQPSITGSCTTNGTTDNTVQLTGIVTTLGLEVGDVIRIQYSGYDKLHTVETITNANSIIVNYEHAGNRGNGSLKLADQTTTVTITRIAKWYSAADGLGQAWVDVTSLRPSSMNTNVLNSTNRKILVSVNSVDDTVDLFLTAFVNGTEINRSIKHPTTIARNAGILFPVHKGENYAYGSAIGESVTIQVWRERR
ncbi:MAG: hypothetical protein M0Q29_09320 [Thiopseudomonas sp.]|nr:hypothetical protein [Thiopseudomonas sp.]